MQLNSSTQLAQNHHSSSQICTQVFPRVFFFEKRIFAVNETSDIGAY